jgi:hypothetical protein
MSRKPRLRMRGVSQVLVAVGLGGEEVGSAVVAVGPTSPGGKSPSGMRLELRTLVTQSGTAAAKPWKARRSPHSRTLTVTLHTSKRLGNGTIGGISLSSFCVSAP